MNARNTPAQAERQVFETDDFLHWLDEFSTPAVISESHDRYFAYCVEFGIAGSGRSKEQAVEEAGALLIRYLVVSFAEGRPYRETKKSPPVKVRARSWYLAVRRRFLGKVKPSLSRLGWLTEVPTTDRDTRGLVH